jgi:O-antigen/teichoic acid export membrane protein
LTEPSKPDLSSRQLRSHVAFGVRWGAIDQGAQFGIRIAAMIALARLLTPSDIGIMGFATIVLSLGSVVVGIGVSDALIQRRRLDAGYVAVAFTISSGTGLLATAATVAVAQPIAALFGEPPLRGVLIAVSVIFFLSGVERTPNDMLVRERLFRDFYLSSTLGTLVAAVVGVAAAAANAGVWSLVAMAITESAVATVLAWAFALRRGIWRPALGWDPERARALLGFGAYVAGSRVIGFARGNADNFAVGKVLGAASLGFYSLAFRTIITPTAKVATILGATAFSVFSSLQDDLPKVRAGLAKANAYVALVCFPLTIGAGITAPLLVPVVFGEQWTPAVRPLEILALLGPYYSFISLDGSVFQAVGRPRLQFWVVVLDLVLVIPAIVIGVQHGLTGVAVAVVIAPYVTLVVRLMMRMRLLHASFMSQVRPILPVGAATICMVAVTLPARKWLGAQLPDAAALVAAIIVGGASYALALRLVAPHLMSSVFRDFRGRGAELRR